MSSILDRLAGIAKALVAAATPGLVIALNDVTAEASVQSTGIVAVIAALILTYLVPNKTPPDAV